MVARRPKEAWLEGAKILVAKPFVEMMGSENPRSHKDMYVDRGQGWRVKGNRPSQTAAEGARCESRR